MASHWQAGAGDSWWRPIKISASLLCACRLPPQSGTTQQLSRLKEAPLPRRVGSYQLHTRKQNLQEIGAEQASKQECVHHSFLTAWPGNDVKPGTEGSREEEAPSSRSSFTLIPFQSYLKQTYFLWFTKGSQFVLPWLRWTWSCAKPCHASLVWITYPSNDSQKVLMWFSHSPFKGDDNHRIISKWLAENG